jgi:WD40 repeat protein
MENGWDVLTANTVEALYTSLGYACGAGMDSFLRNEECLTSVYEKKYIQLYKCSTEFTKRFQKDPQNGCMQVIFIGV